MRNTACFRISDAERKFYEELGEGSLAKGIRKAVMLLTGLRKMAESANESDNARPLKEALAFLNSVISDK